MIVYYIIFLFQKKKKIEMDMDVETRELQNFTEHLNVSYLHTISEVRTTIEACLLPAICTVGLISNTLALITFLQKPLRNKSCSVFLAGRSVSDNGFLGTLLLIWISGKLRLGLGSVLGICQVMLFLTYVCGCISVWLVVFVTAENYIRICHPFLVQRLCTTKCAKIIIFVLTLITLVIYNFPLWISQPDCSPNNAHLAVTQAFIYADTLVTLVVPVILMAGLLVSILCSLIGSYNLRGKYSTPSVQRRPNLLAKVTKMLLAVSVIFLLMNLPSHVIRLQILINSFLPGYQDATYFEGLVQTITYQIYYLSLGINLLVYLAFGQQFRQVFKQTFFKCKADDINGNAKTTTNERLTALKVNKISTTVNADPANVHFIETLLDKQDCK